MINSIHKKLSELNDEYAQILINVFVGKYYAPSMKAVIPFSLIAVYIGITQQMFIHTGVFIAALAVYAHIIFREEMKWRDNTKDIEIGEDSEFLEERKEPKEKVSEGVDELKDLFNGESKNE